MTVDIPDEDPRDGRGAGRGAARSIAIVRLLALVVILGSVELVHSKAAPVTVDHPLFELTFAAATVFATGLATLAWWSARTPRLGVDSVIDVAFLSALTYESGGALSHVRPAFFLLPVAAAMLSRPRVTALWTAVATLTYLAIALPDPDADGAGGIANIASHAGYLAVVGIGATLMSMLIARQHGYVSRLAAARGRLVAATLDAEDQERRRLAYALHDGPVQDVLAAMRSLDRIVRGDTQAADQTRAVLADTTAALRGATFDLHPHTLERHGLAAGIEALARDAASRGELQLDLHLDAAVTTDSDLLVFSAARELLTNTVKHANASWLRVLLSQTPMEVLLEVTDDGDGVPEDALSARDGHLGLLSIRERASALNGRLVVHRVNGQGGTRVVLSLPAPADTCRRA